MEQHALPLKDIHLPLSVSWWPLAPGWWLLALCCLLAIAAWYFRSQLRQLLSPGTRRIALKKLDAIVNHPDLGVQQQVQQISGLLRQTAISRYKRTYVAGLTGAEWLNFLDGSDPERPFSNGIGRTLLDAPYQADSAVDIEALSELARGWIKQLPRQRFFAFSRERD